jgi:hypothetical protein
MESPVVEELQKELVEAIGIVHAYCDQEIRDACLPPSPEQPLLTMANPMAPEAPEDEQRPGKVWVFFHTGGRKLFRMMDGDAPEQHEQHEQHEHDESHERHSGHKQGKPGCHKTTQSTPFFGAENSDANQCVEDMFTSDALSDECKVAVNNALVINDALNQEILAEEYQQFFAGLIAFMLLMTVSGCIVAFAFAPRARQMREARQLKRAVLQTVYDDEEIKALVEKKLGADIGEVAPFRENLGAVQEKAGLCCCVRTICRGLIYAFVLVTLLSFPPLALFVGTYMLIRLCCRASRRRAAATGAQGGYEVVRTDYPAGVAAGDVELKKPVVFVGVPTVV